MSMLARLLTVGVIVGFFPPSGARAQIFQSVDPPDAVETLPFGVRDGTTVGLYQDVQAQFHGFEFTRGRSHLSFDAPGADPQFGTYAIGLDGNGNIFGYFYDTPTSSHGFVRSRTGNIITFDAPGASAAGTLVAAVNRQGTVVGTYLDIAGVMRGFARSADGTQWSIEAPNAQLTQPTSINDNGVIAGLFADGTGTLHGFVFDAGEREDSQRSSAPAAEREDFKTFNAPAGCYFDQYSPVYVNNRGDIATTCLSNSGTSAQGYLRTRTGHVKMINYPGIKALTTLYGITCTGDVAGGYLGTDGTNHAFVRSAKGVYTATDFPGATNTTIFASDAAGDIVGTYNVAFGPIHGFVRYGSQHPCPGDEDRLRNRSLVQ